MRRQSVASRARNTVTIHRRVYHRLMKGRYLASTSSLLSLRTHRVVFFDLLPFELHNWRKPRIFRSLSKHRWSRWTEFARRSICCQLVEERLSRQASLPVASGRSSASASRGLPSFAPKPSACLEVE
jgi:hypothetical protein